MYQLLLSAHTAQPASANWQIFLLSVRRFALTRLSVLGCVAVFLASTSTGFGADISAGQKAASQCTVCHGKDGLATNPEAPNLAGESAIYIEKQLVAFKSGERQHRQMSLVAQGLELETIRNLAAWYQAMKVTVELPSLP